jgi:hypothetical protein
LYTYDEVKHWVLEVVPVILNDIRVYRHTFAVAIFEELKF